MVFTAGLVTTGLLLVPVEAPGGTTLSDAFGADFLSAPLPTSSGVAPLLVGLRSFPCAVGCNCAALGVGDATLPGATAPVASVWSLPVWGDPPLSVADLEGFGGKLGRRSARTSAARKGAASSGPCGPVSPILVT